MMSCPTCGKDVDPLRARNVGVRDGKVVGYCSRECAAAAESRPVAAPVVAAPVIAAKKERARSEPTVPAKRTPPTGVAAQNRRTPPGGIKSEQSLVDSGPVIEILHEPASGVVTSAADARASTGKASAAASTRAETDGAIQVAETGHVDDYVDVDEPPRSRAGWIALAILVVIAGSGFAALRLGYFDRWLHHQHAAKPTAGSAVAARVVEQPAPPKPEVVAAPAALDKARAVLTPLLAGEPSRIQRLAAAALSRTGDPAAQATLVRDLAAATQAGNELEQLEVAYALARAPKADPKWSAQLAAALNSPRRDVKAEAARRLALLGDQRAIPMLLQFLDIAQTKLSAAEQLAYLAEPHALKVLDQVRADPNATPDDRARAAIALGRANSVDVIADLEKLLTDARFNAFAAASLAHLHEPVARTVLVGQLEIPSLRVGAARALRELDPAIDAGPLLVPLVAAVDRGKDTEQVQAAEAILLLAGDVTWSKFE